MKAINFLTIGFITLFSIGAAFAQGNGSVAGSVTDANGAVVVGASVSVQNTTGFKKDVVTNAKGEYSVTNVPAGKYTVKVFATKFELYENTEVEVAAGQKNELMVVLIVGGIVENVDVSNNEQVSTDVDNNKDATVLKGADLEALPDDPDELAAALQALAGAAAGPNGGQIYIDGFTGGQLPSKESIREIRINSNPFSAEFDRPGFGRIEILTRPGSDKFRGSANGSFNDESLNSRNPFALNRAPTQNRNFGGNFSGPITKGKSSFFIDGNVRQNDNNSIINAQILDSSLNIATFRRDVSQPTRRYQFSPRVDFAINDKNTMVVRYNYGRGTNKNQGIGDTSLLSRAFESENREHEIRLTETMIINAKTVNETRFEFSDNKNEQTGDNSIPSINVSTAFNGGGASIGKSFNKNRTFEINNFTSTSFGAGSWISVKFGGRVRHVDISNRSESNYAGTYSFPGFTLRAAAAGFPAETISVAAATLCGFSTAATDPNRTVSFNISPIEQYRCGLRGATDTRFDPTQFTITAGTPELGITQTEYGLFATSDWKFSPALLLSFGLRYENQTNINSNLNFAPRFGFAWSPGAGGARTPKTVFRGGAGVFYDRFGENNTLQTVRFNGVNQLSLLASANDTDLARRAAAVALLAQPVFTSAGVTNSLTAAQILAVLPQSASTIRGVSDVFESPYTMQGAFSVERTFGPKFTLASTYTASRSLHLLRIRNINAPICTTTVSCVGALRPVPSRGNLNFYESSGINNSHRLFFNFRANLSRNFSFNAGYGLAFSKGDQDTPAYSYDLTGEYGRAGFQDIRHTFNMSGNLSLPWGISLNPFVTARSGVPFNITNGTDSNGDGFFTERPTFGQLQTRCNELGLTTAFCHIGENSLTAIVPRNYGQGPKSITVNMRVGKNFGFGKTAAQRAANTGGAGQGGPGGGGGGMIMGGPMGGGGGGGMMRGGGGGGFGGFGGGGDARKPYNLNVGIFVSNLFNTVNLSTPVGSLNSFRFGQSTGTGGGFGGFGGFGGGGAANRRIELNMRFNW